MQGESQYNIIYTYTFTLLYRKGKFSYVNDKDYLPIKKMYNKSRAKKIINTHIKIMPKTIKAMKKQPPTPLKNPSKINSTSPILIVALVAGPGVVT